MRAARAARAVARARADATTTVTAISCTATSMTSMAATPAPRAEAMTRARGYAKPTTKGFTAPAASAAARGGGLRVAQSSSNLIAEPYAGSLRRPTLMEALTSSKGLRFAYESAVSRAKDTYALSKCTRDVRGFTLEGFKQEAKQLYALVNAESANTSAGKTLGHDTRHATTDKTQSDLKRERKSREKGGWAKIDWSLEGIDECQVVRGRLIMANPNDSNGPGFVQLTTRFRSRQRFAAYDSLGRLVAGNPAEVLDVEDFWVFEHGLKLPNARWRLAGRLHMPGPGS
jgi:large subunit ribosomal protein L45